MHLLLMGPPGCGKGTQATMVSQRFGIPHISSGDILRSEVANKTEFGKAVKEYMDRGEIGPADLIADMVIDYINRNCPAGFVLDGFPRTLLQAERLDGHYAILAAICIDVPEEIIVRRITGRRTCPTCKKNYHLDFSPPGEPGRCDACGDTLMQRSDDTTETVRNRLAVYQNQTVPILDFYDTKRVLHRIDGDRDPRAIFEDILKIV